MSGVEGVECEDHDEREAGVVPPARQVENPILRSPRRNFRMGLLFLVMPASIHARSLASPEGRLRSG